MVIPDAYTVIVRSRDHTVGVRLVEITTSNSLLTLV